MQRPTSNYNATRPKRRNPCCSGVGTLIKKVCCADQPAKSDAFSSDFDAMAIIFSHSATWPACLTSKRQTITQSNLKHKMMKTRNLLLGLLLTSFSLAGNAQHFEWAKQIGGTEIESSHSSTLDQFGNVYHTGVFQGTVDFDPGPNTYNLTSIGITNVFVVKLDSKGELVWAQQFADMKDNQYISIAVDQLQNVYIACTFRDSLNFSLSRDSVYLVAPKNLPMLFIAKLNASGNLSWIKQLTGKGMSYTQSIQIDAGGNIHLAGFFRETVDFDPGPGTYNLTSVIDSSAWNTNVYILKLDSSGSFIWARMLGGTANLIGLEVKVDVSGNVLTSGFFSGTADFNPGAGTYNLTSADRDGFITKLDPSGNFIWAKQFGGKSSAVYIYNMALDGLGNVYTSGELLTGEADFDPGAGVSTLSALNGENFICKLDASGKFIWAKQIANLITRGIYLYPDKDRNLFFTTQFDGTKDFDLGPGTFHLTSDSSWPSAICKLDASGNFVWAKQIGGKHTHVECKAIFGDNSGNIYTSGVFYASVAVDFDPGTDTFHLKANGNFDAFILKLSQPTLGLQDEHFSQELRSYPNPTSGQFTLTGSEPFRNPTLTVRNIQGQELFRKSYTATDRIEVNLDMPAGLYIAELLDRGQKATIKVIKQ
jgi:hypothetical protein